MASTDSVSLRKELVDVLDGRQAHLTFPAVISGFPFEKAGEKPEGAPHSAWELVEHLRITQRDIPAFSLPMNYKPLNWPDDYWPKTAAPASEEVWKQSIQSFEQDLEAMKKLANDEGRDLFAPLEHGEGQTLLREILLVADHNSHHLGQLIFLKKLLGVAGK